MKTPELWDAVDREGRPLGFDLIRGEPIPEGAYHHVVLIFTLTDRGNILLTQRHPDKPFGLMWEVTGGSVLKGETPQAGAARELREETGIAVAPEELRPLFAKVWDGIPAIYHHYLVRVPEEGFSVTLQEGETVAWKLVPYEQAKQMILDLELPMFPDPFCRRFRDFASILDRAVRSLL